MMDQNNRNNTPDNDAAGDVISWVIVFILMFAFWPIGLLLLIRKLRGYSKPAMKTAGWANMQYKDTTSYTNYQSTDSARQTSSQAASQSSGAARAVGEAARQAASQAAGTAREFSEAARKAAREFEYAARQAVSQYPGQTAKRTASQYAGYTKRAAPGEYANTARDYSQPQKKEQKKKKDQNRLEKKSGKFISVVLLLIAITLFIIGANTIARAAQDIWGNGNLNSWRDLWMGVFYFIGAFISFFSRNIGVRRYSRYKKYFAYVGERGIVPVADLALVSGRSSRAVNRDIQSMINDGYFGPNAYIDSELDSLVIFAEAAKEARQARYAAYASQEQPSPGVVIPDNQYMAIILELRELNTTIADISISDKIDRIEELTAKIFRIVEDDPSKLPQIRRFMNYYLPTTLKLLHSYALLEKQGIKGENITAAKENISRILDTLATGYEQQLDQLFQSDVIDIAADINVLENLMQQDGLPDDRPLAEDKQEMKTMEGTM